MKVLAADLYPRLVRTKLMLDAAARGDCPAQALSELAQVASLSKYHFLRLFRHCFGCTPHQYLMGQRLLQSRRLLNEGRTLEQVCQAIGLESVGSFAALFKRRFGLTPARYRLEALRRQQLVRTEPGRFIPACFADRLVGSQA